MSRPSLIPTLAFGLGALLAGAPASADPVSVCAVAQAEFRFRDAESTRTRFRLDGDLNASASLAAVDPAASPLRLAVGGFALIDLPDASQSPRFRASRRGWRVEVGGAFGGEGRVSFRMDPATGIFSVDAKGFAPAALLATGSDAVPVTLTVGGETWATSVDFDAARPGRWTHRIAPPPPPPFPGGGGGGGGDSGGLVTLAGGFLSGITSARFVAVKDQASWDALWLEHAGSLPAPSVDFSTRMVVGAWLGLKTSTGYTVTVQRLVVPFMVVTGGECPPCPMCGVPCFGGDATPGALADCLEVAPGPGCVVGGAITYPFHVVSVPRVEGPVAFQLLTATYCN